MRLIISILPLLCLAPKYFFFISFPWMLVYQIQVIMLLLLPDQLKVNVHNCIEHKLTLRNLTFLVQIMINVFILALNGVWKTCLFSLCPSLTCCRKHLRTKRSKIFDPQTASKLIRSTERIHWTFLQFCKVYIPSIYNIHRRFISWISLIHFSFTERNYWTLITFLHSKKDSS